MLTPEPSNATPAAPAAPPAPAEPATPTPTVTPAATPPPPAPTETQGVEEADAFLQSTAAPQPTDTLPAAAAAAAPAAPTTPPYSDRFKTKEEADAYYAKLESDHALAKREIELYKPIVERVTAGQPVPPPAAQSPSQPQDADAEYRIKLPDAEVSNFVEAVLSGDVAKVKPVLEAFVGGVIKAAALRTLPKAQQQFQSQWDAAQQQQVIAQESRAYIESNLKDVTGKPELAQEWLKIARGLASGEPQKYAQDWKKCYDDAADIVRWRHQLPKPGVAAAAPLGSGRS